MIKSLETYFNLMSMNGTAYVFNIANKMKFFKPFVIKEQLTSTEIAKALCLKENPVKLVLETLISIKVLEKNGDLYSLSSVTKYLTGNYENLSSDYWEHLPKLLTEGNPYKKMDQVSDSENEYKVQVKSLEWMMSPSAVITAKMFPISKKNNLSILDVGAGSGVWSFAFLKENETATAALADWPGVLDVAKDSAKKQNLNNRVKYIEGNYHETNFNSDYDLAIIANVTHIESTEGNQSLFKKIKAALRPNGILLIVDVFGNNKKGDVNKCLYQLGLALRTTKGEVYPPATLQEWLTTLGYREFNFHSLDVVPYTMGILSATTP